MMRDQEDLFTYLRWRGDIPFSAMPPGAIDAVIMAELVYIDFQGILAGTGETGAGVSLREAAAVYRERYLEEKGEAQYTREEQLFMALAGTVRFSDLELDSYEADTDMVLEMQFAAMRAVIGRGEAFVVYRGTDGTLVGWKENFNMTFQFPGPGQTRAVEYLNRLGEPGDGLSYRLCGHSKGGNLAMCAAIYCREEIQDRIKRVYMFDAPGFFINVWETPEFARIRHRVESYVPQGSVVGVLLEYYPEYRVVDSGENGPSQHIPFTWILDGPDFRYVEKRDAPSLLLEDSLHQWVTRIPLEQRKPSVDAFFEAVAGVGIARLAELRSMSFSQFAALVRNLGALSGENKDTLLALFKRSGGEENTSPDALPPKL